MLALVRTPDQHDQVGISDPPTHAIPQSDLLVAELQECATTPSRKTLMRVPTKFTPPRYMHKDDSILEIILIGRNLE
jgi:hypothetical protein